MSAQSNPQGVPKELLEAKKLELIQEKVSAYSPIPARVGINYYCRLKPKRLLKKPESAEKKISVGNETSTRLGLGNVAREAAEGVEENFGAEDEVTEILTAVEAGVMTAVVAGSRGLLHVAGLARETPFELLGGSLTATFLGAVVVGDGKGGEGHQFPDLSHLHLLDQLQVHALHLVAAVTLHHHPDLQLAVAS